jgi:glycosyltransferase involved in cell wall biosynthesis
MVHGHGSGVEARNLPPRITFLCHEYVPIGGGAASALDAITKVLARRGRSIQIITIGLGKATTEEVDSVGRNIVRFGVGRKNHLCPSAWDLLRSYLALRYRSQSRLRTFRPDLLIAYFAFPAGLAALALRNRLGIPLVVSLRGSDVPGFSNGRWGAARCLQKLLVRPVWERADLLLANGTRLVDLAHRFVPAPKARNWSNGIDTEHYRPGAIRSADESLRVLFVGQLIERKRCREAVQAVKWLGEQGIAAHLTVVGDGPERPGLEALVSGLPKHIHVSFTGAVGRSEMPAIYRDHDVLMHLSSAEGVSNVLMEAMASGLAVVCTRAAAEHVYARQRQAAIFVRSLDPSDVGKELLQLALDAKKRWDMQRRARRLSQLYDWKRAADELEDYCCEVF